MQHLQVVIRGRVQGVGYRWFVRREALALGLRGAVWNRRDGGVEAEAEGPRDALEQWLETLREGPGAAIVTSAEASWSEGPSRHRSFEIRPTAWGDS